MAIKVDGLERVLAQLDSVKTVDRAMNTATRRTRTAAKTIASAAIRKELALKKKYIDEKINVFAKYEPPGWGVRISMKREGITMGRFRHSITKKGIMRITIKPGKTTRIKGAFFLPRRQDGKPMPVFWKKKPSAPRGHPGYWKNLAVYAASPSQVLASKEREVAEALSERFRREISGAVNYHIAKSKRG